MKEYYFFDFHYYSENTPEYGHGDYPDRIYYFLGRVQATTKRKAQNIIKKLYPELRLTFGGMFSPLVCEATDLSSFKNTITDPIDIRMGSKAQRIHNKALKTL